MASQRRGNSRRVWTGELSKWREKDAKTSVVEGTLNITNEKQVELKRVAEDGRVLKTHTKPVQCLDLIL